MSQCSQFNNLIKKMAVYEPALKLLCHFDDNTTDSSSYNRPAIIPATVDYRSGTKLSKFSKSVYALGGGSPRHDGYVGYDISDVDLSGSFCIDYWFRDYGGQAGTPMVLIPFGVDPLSYSVLTSPLLHYNGNYEDRGFHTYDPTTDTQQVCNYGYNDSSIHHVAVTRDDNNTLRWFYDGVLKVSYTNAYDFSSQEIHVARTYNNNLGRYICLDELRIVAGEPCYTENFTPPTEPYTVS